MVRQGLELVSSDAVLRVSGTAVYAVNRFTFDNLQRLDPPEGFVTAWQIGVGSGANPQDIVMFDEDKGYVTRYEPPFDDVAVLDARTRRIVDSISLRGLAENPDATPRASRLTLAEGAVFVGLQDIDRTFSHFAEGKLAVIDPRLDEVAGVIPLGGKNPGQIEVLRGADGRVRLWVALGGIFAGLQDQELSGGVAVVDAFDRVFERMALDDDVAGGNIGALAMASERLGYVVVSDERFRNSVLAFDPQVSEVLRSVTESFYLIPELEVDSGGVLAVPDRDAFQPRLCLHRTPVADGETEISVGCARLTLPPFSIEALD
jgi:DNA-binding beta-propeller fold protein YncE